MQPGTAVITFSPLIKFLTYKFHDDVNFLVNIMHRLIAAQAKDGLEPKGITDHRSIESKYHGDGATDEEDRISVEVSSPNRFDAPA